MLRPSTGYLVKVAFIGIGNMGKPMATNVVKGGYEVLLFDVDPSRAGRSR
jgi:3-hydroxyisobutyrate dehydrogenase